LANKRERQEIAVIGELPCQLHLLLSAALGKELKAEFAAEPNTAEAQKL